MSDYSPPPRPGYTRTGKSLKAVRRYYAMKNNKRKRQERSPDDRDDESNRKESQRGQSISKRKRSPDDDKLSKRIAAELRVQQEALEKRKDREPVQIIPHDQQTDVPMVIQPRETGPIFFTESERPPTKSISVKSASGKSIKSNKSTKSATTRAAVERSQANVKPQKLGSQAIGCVLICLVMAVVFIATWTFRIMSAPETKSTDPTTPAVRKRNLNNLNHQWLAITSAIIIIVVPYWLLFKEGFKHALVALILMTISTITIVAYFVYNVGFNPNQLPLKPPVEVSDSPDVFLRTQNPLLFWFSVSFLVAHLLALCFMIKQTLHGISKQVNEKSGNAMSDPQMSMYLSPN